MKILIAASDDLREWQSLRGRAFAAVTQHLIDGGLEYLLATAPAEQPWSPGRARNTGAWDNVTLDPLVFNDADTIVPHGQIREAARLAAEAPGLVYAYTVYVRRNPDGSDSDDVHGGSASIGCAAISRQCFEQVGGFDESYVGWGYEDLDFARRCAKLWPVRRVEGLAFHLWHGERNPDGSSADSEPLQVAANRERWLESELGLLLDRPAPHSSPPGENLGSHLGAQEKVSLLEEYGRRYNLTALVETGLYNANGSGMHTTGFDRYIVVDCQPENVEQAQANGFDARLGDSAELLPEILAELDGPALFWLDAHGVGDDPQTWPQFPLYAELEALANDPRPHVILIDDLWMMLPGSWLPLRGAPPLAELRSRVDNYGRWRREDKDEVMRLTPQP